MINKKIKIKIGASNSLKKRPVSHKSFCTSYGDLNNGIDTQFETSTIKLYYYWDVSL